MQNLDTGKLAELADDSQESKNEAIPEEKHQGEVFHVGELLELKGGIFRIRSFGKRFMTLEGMPGTRIKNGNK